ncbi:MAG: HEAT repeat domain-containing protein, partial [Planctomycetota bacterium]|nr:HEAT repeat domain-containing protein [Planctomycetota bacterium]
MKRQWAILMIGLLAAGCDPASRAKGYIEAMRTDDEQRYYQAADQLRHLLHTDPEAIPATTAALADPDYRVRAGAAYGLGADLCNVHPYPTDRVAPALTGVLGDGDPAARISAANSRATLHRPDPKVLAV